MSFLKVGRLLKAYGPKKGPKKAKNGALFQVWTSPDFCRGELNKPKEFLDNDFITQFYSDLKMKNSDSYLLKFLSVKNFSKRRKAALFRLYYNNQEIYNNEPQFLGRGELAGVTSSSRTSTLPK